VEGWRIVMWGRSTLELERTLAGHTDLVCALLSAGGKLFSCSSDEDIRAWDIDGGLCKGLLKGHKA
jgi:WD40 repeat protein